MRKRGLTLIEMMIGSLLIFAAAATVAASIASYSSYLRGSRLRLQSDAAFQQLTQRIVPALQINSSQALWAGLPAAFTSPSPSYTFVPASLAVVSPAVGSSSYAASTDSLGLATVTLSSATGKTLSFDTLLRQHAVQQVACSTNDVYFVNGRQMAYRYTKASAVAATSGPPLALPGELGGGGFSTLILRGMGGGTQPGSGAGSVVGLPNLPSESGTPHTIAGLATDGNEDYLLATDDTMNDIHFMMAPATATAWPPERSQLPDTQFGLPMGVISNPTVASDATAMPLYFIDSQQRCLWLAQVSQTSGLSAAMQVCVPGAGSVPLLRPTRGAMDPSGTVVYLADEGNLCLREYYPNAALPTWSAPIRPSSGALLMGLPRAVAVSNSTLYVVDNQTLWIGTGGSPAAPGFPAAWTAVALASIPVTGSNAGVTPLGHNVNSMQFDPQASGSAGSDTVWLDTDDSYLYQLQVAPSGGAQLTMITYQP